jgi:hypothetical protein
MHRRVLLSSLAAGVLCGSGCLGGGNDIVTTVARSVSVRPGDGWMAEIQDVSGSGGAIQYKARAARPFEIYFFTTDEQYMFYDTLVDGGDPARTPTGDEAIGDRAEQVSDSAYEASTPNNGARQSIDATGPYYFVVDHSHYGAIGPDETATPLSVFVDMTVTERSLL